MLRSRKNNSKNKNLHERCLRLIYSDKKSSCENLLKKYNSVFIHNKNIQVLGIPEITGDIFMGRTNNQCSLRHLIL